MKTLEQNLRYLFCIKTFKKYLFGLIVSVYVINVIGIPVYFHYCGGELEEVNYVVKGSNCCGGEEAADNGCCKDEGLVLQSSTDFTIKEINHFNFVKAFCELHYVSLPFSISYFFPEKIFSPVSDHSPPERTSDIISTTVLRI